MKVDVNELCDIFDVELFPTRNEMVKSWKIVCKWDNSVIPDMNINCRPDQKDRAMSSLKGILARVVNKEYKHTMALEHKIIEYYLLGQ